MLAGVLLRGCTSECAQLDELLAVARGGRSGALVLRGDAGIGKTALVEYVAAAGDGARVLRAEGVEAEVELTFAAAARAGSICRYLCRRPPCLMT
jgi:hypothetical protein